MSFFICTLFLLANAPAFLAAVFKGDDLLKFTSMVGTTACGSWLDASKEEFAALGQDHWGPGSNPNEDPVCKKCVEVNINGRKKVLPVKEKCYDCAKNQLLLTMPVFMKLTDNNSRTKGVNWKFAACGSASSSKDSAPAAQPAPVPAPVLARPVPAFPSKNTNTGSNGGGASVSITDGIFSWYNDNLYPIPNAYSACGGKINAATEELVAIPEVYWTNKANPNNDPLCKKCINVTYKGKSVNKVPIKDKCPTCTANKVDLSVPIFQKLANLDVGILDKSNGGVSWSIVEC